MRRLTVQYLWTRQCYSVDRRMLEHGLAGCTSATTSAELVFRDYVSLVSWWINRVLSQNLPAEVVLEERVRRFQMPFFR